MPKKGVPLNHFPIDEENRFIKAYRKIDWSRLNQLKANVFDGGFGTIQPIERVLAMIILKRVLHIDAATLFERWIEIPAMQYFTGEDWFYWELPITAEEITACEAHLSPQAAGFIDDAVKTIGAL